MVGGPVDRTSGRGRSGGVGLLAVALALVVLAGACSGGDGADDAASGEAPGTTTPARRTDVDLTGVEVSGPLAGGRGVPQTATPIDLAGRGYVEEEYLVAGDAVSYRAVGTWGPDGRWAVEPAERAPFTTRIIVRRPTDPTAANGTVVVEWMNVSSGVDADIDFGFAAEELLRGGYTWVGVSAQEIAFDSDGSASRFGPGAVGLKRWDPERYAELRHPGDEFSYDIFSKVGAVLRQPGAVDPLAGAAPERVLATGESQSAFRMVTYANAVQPVARAYDGILIHSRDGGGAPLGEGMTGGGTPAAATIRTDTEVPVLQVQSETDLFALRADDPTRAFPLARQPDTDRVRTWEVAGTAHSDAHYLRLLSEQGRRQFPDFLDLSGVLPVVNNGPQNFVMNAAVRSLRDWVAEGRPPASAPPIETTATAIVRDDLGNARGGLRTPQLDVPVAVLSGEGAPLIGRTTPFDEATLRRLYPTRQAYLDAFDQALDRAIAAGHLLPDDAPAIRAQAEAAAASM